MPYRGFSHRGRDSSRPFPVGLSRHVKKIFHQHARNVETPFSSGMVFSTGAFLGAFGTDWSVSLKMVRSVLTGCCGGQGMFMNELHGRSTVFLSAGGTVLSKVWSSAGPAVKDTKSVLLSTFLSQPKFNGRCLQVLGPGEEIVVDKHAVLVRATSACHQGLVVWSLDLALCSLTP